MDIAFFKGFVIAAGLIVAIGAQNAFVLRQGLKREHVLAVVLVCALSDLLLIVLGVAGLGTLVQQSPLLFEAARWGGALFLLGYGFAAARRAGSAQGMRLQAEAPLSLRAALATCLAFTFLNPHVWLDTVVLLGTIAGQQPDAARYGFAAGAASASLVWFVALGFGARLLRPIFAKPAAWRLLDGGIACVMCFIAVSLLRAPGLG